MVPKCFSNTRSSCEIKKILIWQQFDLSLEMISSTLLNILFIAVGTTAAAAAAVANSTAATAAATTAILEDEANFSTTEASWWKTTQADGGKNDFSHTFIVYCK